MIKFNGLSRDSGQLGPYSPYSRIITAYTLGSLSSHRQHTIYRPQLTLRKNELKKNNEKVRAPIKLTNHWIMLQ